jgi:hypothetical protein
MIAPPMHEGALHIWLLASFLAGIDEASASLVMGLTMVVMHAVITYSIEIASLHDQVDAR